MATFKELEDTIAQLSKTIAELKSSQGDGKQAERALGGSMKSYEQMLDAVTDMIICKDQQSRIVYANKAFRDFYGMTMDELEGTVDAPFVKAEHTRQYIEDDAYVFRTGRVRDIPEEPVTKYDGTVSLVHTIKSPIFDSNGRAVLTVAVIRDVTANKQVQERNQRLNSDLEKRIAQLNLINSELETMTDQLTLARDEALEASKLKSQFVANISHEIRTPISGVIGMTELLLDTGLTDGQKPLVLAAQDSAQSLLMLINDILDFSKIEAGKIALLKSDFSLLNQIENSAQLLAPAASQKHLSLMTYIDPSIPKLVSGDSQRIRQILLNLLSNAIKFTEAGEILVSAHLQTTGLNTCVVRFTVTDTGIGITQSEQEMLFNPFVQVDGSSTRQYGGTGLGLSICKRLVELMEGEIGVESKVGHGSTFWFALPFDVSDKLLVEDDWFYKDALTQSKKTENVLPEVLVATTSDTTASILTNYLQLINIDCDTALGPTKALRMLNQRHETEKQYRLLLVDLGSDHDFSNAARLISLVTNNSDFARTNLILISSISELSNYLNEQNGSDDTNWLETKTATHRLFKPVKQAELFDAVVRSLIDQAQRNNESTQRLLSGDTKRAQGGSGPGGSARSSEQSKDNIARFAAKQTTFNGRTILIVEDNELLQSLTYAQLCKLGYTVSVASNGLEAIEIISESQFDLILMDCYTPIVDGFAATRQIRKLETSSGRHTPIIAITASAMAEDRQKCLNSGMDDYLCKPVSVDRLRQTLEHWISLSNKEAKDNAGQTGEAGTDLLTDHERGQNSCQESLSLLQENYGAETAAAIVISFVQESTTLLAEIAAALAKMDGQRLYQAAHQLKGAISVLRLEQLDEICRELEVASRKSQWDKCQQDLADLSQQITAVNETFSKLMAPSSRARAKPD